MQGTMVRNLLWSIRNDVNMSTKSATVYILLVLVYLSTLIHCLWMLQLPLCTPIFDINMIIAFCMLNCKIIIFLTDNIIFNLFSIEVLYFTLVLLVAMPLFL